MSWLSKAVKNVTNSAKKAVNTVGDAFSFGAYSKATGADSYLNDITKKITGKDYLETLTGIGQNILGGNLGTLGGESGNILSSLLGVGINWGNSIFSAKQAKEMAEFNSGLQYKYQTMLNQQAQNYDREMANTAVQRRVEDLKAADINPILAATDGAGGGGLSGGNAQPSQADWMNYQLQAQAAQRDAQRVEIERSNSASSAALMAAQEQKTLADMSKTIAELPYVSRRQEAQINNILAGTVKTKAESAKAIAEAEKIPYETRNIMEQTETNKYNRKTGRTGKELGSYWYNPGGSGRGGGR